MPDIERERALADGDGMKADMIRPLAYEQVRVVTARQLMQGYVRLSASGFGLVDCPFEVIRQLPDGSFLVKEPK